MNSQTDYITSLYFPALKFSLKRSSSFSSWCHSPLLLLLFVFKHPLFSSRNEAEWNSQTLKHRVTVLCLFTRPPSLFPLFTWRFYCLFSSFLSRLVFFCCCFNSANPLDLCFNAILIQSIKSVSWSCIFTLLRDSWLRLAGVLLVKVKLASERIPPSKHCLVRDLLTSYSLSRYFYQKRQVVHVESTADNQGWEMQSANCISMVRV